jgi:hypothetical protein
MLVEECGELCPLVSTVDAKQSKHTRKMSFDGSRFHADQFCDF